MPERDPLTSQILGAAFKVANALGPGFLEKVYENALAHELGKSALDVQRQHGLDVYYDGISVGHFVVDLIVERNVLVELKACKGLEDIHIAQCLNYLTATKMETCLLINFGKPKIEIRRLMMSGKVLGQLEANEELISASDGQR